MRNLFFFPLVFFAAFSVMAQKKVAVKNGNKDLVFSGSNPLQEAYDASSNGDTIYIPGGFFTLTGPVNKRLKMFGVGHYPDSTSATSVTSITSNLTFEGDADNSLFEGIEFSNITILNTADSLYFKRCSIGTLSFTDDNTPNTQSENNKFIQNLIRGHIYMADSYNNFFSNNIIQRRVYDGSFNSFLNNIFIYYEVIRNVDNSNFNNNIFMIYREYGLEAFYIVDGSENTVFRKNLFQNSISNSVNLFIDNYFENPTRAALVNVPLIYYTDNYFSYTFNYHLNNRPAYIGTDGTEIGIYGGLYPFKEGAVPQIPHYQSINIAPATDQNGMLNIQIKVTAQNN